MYLHLTCSISYGVKQYLDTRNVNKFNLIQINSIDRGLRHMSQFVKMNTHTNVIIASAPHCYDLAASSKVNQEVQKFNRKLKNLWN
jgi:hypothetical protein